MGGGSDFQFVYKGYHHFRYSSSSRTCPVCCALFEEKKETMNDTTSKKVLLESVNYLLALPSRRERNEILGKKMGEVNFYQRNISKNMNVSARENIGIFNMSDYVTLLY